MAIEKEILSNSNNCRHQTVNFYQLKDVLTADELALVKKVRAYMKPRSRR